MGAQSAGQVWRGRVVRVLPDGLVWVVVPQLMGDEPLGPMPTHGATVVGARVLVVLLGGSRQDMIAVPDPDARFSEVTNGLGALWEAMAGKANTEHQHTMSDVSGLLEALAEKQPAGDYATNTALATGLAGKANSSHTHTAAQTTSGTFAAARLPLVTTSTAGAMYATHYVLLGNATDAATGGTLVKRDTAGNFKSGTPSATTDVTNKDYVDGKVWPTANLADNSVTSTKLSAALRDLLDQYGIGIGDVQARTTMAYLGSTENLNDLIPPNNQSRTYGQALSANTSLDRNYPVARAGMLEAFSNHSGNMVWQRYTVYQSAWFAVYVRAKYLTTWGAWQKLAFETAGGGGSLKDSLSAPQNQATYHWLGSAHASQSIMRLDGVEVTRNFSTNPSLERTRADGKIYQPNITAGTSVITTGGGASADYSTDWAASGNGSLRISTGTGNATAAYPHALGGAMAQMGLVPGGTYTVSATICVPVIQTGTLDSGARGISIGSVIGGVTNYSHAKSNQAPNEPGTYRVSVTFTVPPDAENMFVRLMNGSTNTHVFWDEYQIEQGATLGHYFDGDTDWSTSLWLDRARVLRQWDGDSWEPVG